MTGTANLYGVHLKEILSFYDELLNNQGYSGLLIPSGVPRQQFLDDNPYPFKVNIHFKALLPVTEVPHSYIIYQPGSKPVLVFYQPEDYWHVVPSDPEGDWVNYFDIQIVSGIDDWQKLLPVPGKNLVWLGEPQAELGSLGIGSVNPEQLLNPIHYRRACKSEYEVACLQQANLKAARGHLAAKAAFIEGASELEIHLAYLRACKHKEEELPYGNIVAINNHGAILHYTDLQRRPYPDAGTYSFLLDAGAVYNGYCADITRTWACRDCEFKDLIKGFDLLQLDLIRELSAGQSYVDMHLLAHFKIAEFLKDAEFINCDADTALATGVSSTFFPHGLGHLLGLQVHDIGGHQITASGDIKDPPKTHPFLRLTKVLEPGHCVTIEPGIYFIDLLLDQLSTTKYASLVNWSKVEAYKKYGGIRIEDDVVINSNGTENLTRTAFDQVMNENC